MDNVTTEDSKHEKKSIAKETLGKFFYDLAKLIFAGIVLGEVFLLQDNASNVAYWIMTVLGAAMTWGLAWIGNKFLKSME